IPPLPPSSTLLPYTTLFRSSRGSLAQLVEQRTFNPLVGGSNPPRPTIFSATYVSFGNSPQSLGAHPLQYRCSNRRARCPTLRWRSEEHTSELQSRFDLVCRL